LDETSVRAQKFKETYENQLSFVASDNPKSLLQAIEEYESIVIRQSLVSSYLSLSYDTQLKDDALKKRKGAVSQKQSEIRGNFLEWFELDVSAMPSEDLQKHEERDTDLVKYKSYLEELRRQQPHNLQKDVERALTVRVSNG
jgi:oligoendopeptidase F